MNITNQLVPYDLTPEKINQTISEKFDLDTFLEGPDGMVKLVYENLLTDSDSNRLKTLFTDMSRRTCQYIDSSGNLHSDPGFQMTHNMISDPLIQANLLTFVDKLNKNPIYEFTYERNSKCAREISIFVNLLFKLYGSKICFNTNQNLDSIDTKV